MCIRDRCDVAPDGASTLVSWGLLNLTHHKSHEFPEPLEPERRYRVTVQLNVIGHRLAAGHRWRVSVTPTYVRHAWPSPRSVTLTVFCGANSRLRLPVRAPSPDDAALPDYPPPETATAPFAQMVSNLLDSVQDDGFSLVYALHPQGLELGLGPRSLAQRHSSQLRVAPPLPADAERDKCVLVPIGHTEQHGHHLPLSTDTLIIGAIGQGTAAAVPDLACLLYTSRCV